MRSTILFNRKKQIFHLAFFLAIIVSFLFDELIAEIFLRIHNPLLDIVFIFFSDLTVIAIFILLVSIVMLKIRKDHKWIPAMFCSMILSFIVTYYLKFFFARARPGGFEMITAFGLIDYSFPSYHTALAFSMIPLLDKGFSHHRKLWIFLGVMVGLSRIYLRVHYISDVLAGAFIGLLCGELMLLLEKKYGWFTWVSKTIWK